MTDKKFEISKTWQRVFLAMIFIGALGLIIGFLWKPERTWGNFLINSYYFICLSLSGLLFTAIQYVSGARWSEVLRRIPEALMSYLPFGGLVLLVLFFGMHSLYHWSHGEALDEILLGKASYLNVPFFFIRLVVIVAGWSLFAKLIRKNSLSQDQTGDFSYYKKNIALSAVFLIFFAFSLSFFSYDLIMSTEPHWFSTMFAVYNFAGLFVNGVVVTALLAIFLRERGFFPEFTQDHLHDLGKFIFAFSIFWAYIWFSQFMLIWYGNIPEETVYFYDRFHGGWRAFFFLNFFMNFIVPFFVLMTRKSKRNIKVVKGLCVWLLLSHWVDIYLMAMPGVTEMANHAAHAHVEGPMISMVELMLPFGFAGVFLWIVTKSLTHAALLPQKTPFLEQSLHHHQ